ncbi:MAG: type IV secretory system conjugative DNA transfer family protein [Acidimicrobiaceae bacterium]|nr:type IV secretory system conjugative DNA transfer family protein [Acidimicrobiaceae bacterium]
MTTDPRLERLHQYLRARGGGLYIGSGPGGLAFAAPQQAALVLGPPRSGKTSTLVIPNVLAAPGAVVATSTKPDVLLATLRRRASVGRCWLLDPTGTVRVPEGVTPIRWSPVQACRQWDEALVSVRAMVGAGGGPRLRNGDATHWTERAEAMLAPLLHAAAITGGDMERVVRWVLRQDLETPHAELSARGATLASDVLAGLAATDSRELSGIWSTAAGVLAAYRSEAALVAARAPNFDPRTLPATSDTVYVCAPARHQALAAPIVVAFLEQLRAGAFTLVGEGQAMPPVVLALDELANIAPIPDLPSLVSEGGGQGLLTLGCLQDLSQARQRWGPAAEGFLSLFGTKVVLGGIADVATLELVSRLGGDVDLPVRSISRAPWWAPGRGAPTTTWSTRRQRRIPVDAVSQQPAGTGLVLVGNRPPTRVGLRPWWEVEPFATPTVTPRPFAHPRATLQVAREL